VKGAWTPLTAAAKPKPDCESLITRLGKSCFLIFMQNGDVCVFVCKTFYIPEHESWAGCVYCLADRASDATMSRRVNHWPECHVTLAVALFRAGES
jgi:hypothetical protein